MSSPAYTHCEQCGQMLQDGFSICTFCSTAFCSPDCLWTHYNADHPTRSKTEKPASEQVAMSPGRLTAPGNAKQPGVS